MVVVLCDSWPNAQHAYDAYLRLLEVYEPPWFVCERYDLCCALRTEEDIRYIFIDYRIQNRFRQSGNDFIEVGMFLSDAHDYYANCPYYSTVFPTAWGKDQNSNE